jgi:RHS repeat-associated protein
VDSNVPLDTSFSSSTTHNYTDTNHDHAVTGLSTGESYTYDANGNMITRVEDGLTYTQTFDAENRLISVTVSGQTTQFVYDGDGNLIKKIKPDGSETLYVGGVYEVDKAAGGSVTRTVTYYPAVGAMRIDSTLYYVLKDHLGSASVVTDASGNLNLGGEQRYYPFGEARLTTSNMLTDHLFTGQREITDLGIYHYGARFYSPYINQFLSADTIVPGYANPQSWNRFSYVTNNPLRYTDPTGHRRDEGQGSKRGCSDKGYCSISAKMNIKIGKDYSREDSKILRDLLRSGNSDAKEAVDYLVNNGISIQHVEKDELGEAVGAAWWNIKHPTQFDTLWLDSEELEKDYSYGLSLVVHETVHLQQGAVWALSILGEQEAWQVGFEVYYDLEREYPGDQQVAKSIVELPYDASPETLERARDLMLQFQPDYGANWLPLYPLNWYLIHD